MTKLVPKGKVMWRFPEDVKDEKAVTFIFTVRSNRNRIESQWKKERKLIDTADDFALDCYGQIDKIENADGETLTDKKKIVAFCMDRLFENQGTQLQLAITGGGDYLDEGLVKN